MPAVFAGLVFVLLFVVYPNDKIYSQNLVPDPSFEDYLICPLSTNQIPWEVLQCCSIWFPPPYFGTPDYYNICSFNERLPIDLTLQFLQTYFRQYPRTGNGMIALALYNGLDTLNQYCNAEFIQVQLKRKLDTGKRYWFSTWVLLHDSVSTWGIDKIQAFFSDTLIHFEQFPPYQCLFNFIPQVSNPEFRIITDIANWTKVEGSFIAKGGEEYLMIGNYTPWQETNAIQIKPLYPSTVMIDSYYFFDDVAVYEDGTPFYEADAGVGDTCVARGTQLVLGGVARDEYLYWWYNKQGDLISTQSSIVVTATESTTYYLRQKDFKFDETLDSINIKVGNCTEIPDYSGYDFAIYPNPNNGDFQVRFNTAVPDGAVLELYDLLGRKIAEYPLSGSENIANINGIEVASAIYYATVVVPNSFRKSVKMVVIK